MAVEFRVKVKTIKSEGEPITIWLTKSFGFEDGEMITVKASEIANEVRLYHEPKKIHTP